MSLLQESPGLFRKANVLAVDDQRANLVALDAVLGSEYNVIRAGSGSEALSILEQRQDIDVILMDVQMPVMDGFEAASRIKHMENCQDIPIIFVTAVYNDDPFVKQGYKVGAVDYFSKPFDPEILRVKVGIYASFRQRADILKERARQIQASEELLAVGRKLSAVLQDVRMGIIIADSAGRITQTNEEVFRLWKSLEPCGADFSGQILGWWDSNGHFVKGEPGPLARALESGESSHNECLEIRGAGGIPKTVFCSASPLRDLDGRIVGAVLMLQDMTERRTIERDMQQRIASLASARRELASG